MPYSCTSLRVYPALPFSSTTTKAPTNTRHGSTRRQSLRITRAPGRTSRLTTKRCLPLAPEISQAREPHEWTKAVHPRVRFQPVAMDVDRLNEFRFVVIVFLNLISEGLRQAAFNEAIVEPIPTALFVSHAMISTPAIFLTIRNILIQAGVDTIHVALYQPRNSPVPHKCATEIWGSEADREVVAECIRTLHMISYTLLSPCSSRDPSPTGVSDPLVPSRPCASSPQPSQTPNMTLVQIEVERTGPSRIRVPPVQAPRVTEITALSPSVPTPPTGCDSPSWLK